MFGAVDGGYEVLLDELVRRADFRWAQVAVERVERREQGWRLVDDEGSAWHADAVLLAVPAPRLATIVAGRRSAHRGGGAAHRSGLDGTGGAGAARRHAGARAFRCAGGQRRTVARQGDHACRRANGGRGGNVELVRLSFGRFGDDMARSVGDDDLLSWAGEDLAQVFGITNEPVDCRVHRWIDAMPQYGPGHGDLVAELRAGLPPSLAVAGAYLDGIGVPACIAAATRAAALLVTPARGTIEAMARLDYDALNSTLRYLMFSVFAARPGALGDERAAIVDEAATFFKQQEDNGVVVRGLYDVAGMRADADFMIWTHAERVEALQA